MKIVWAMVLLLSGAAAALAAVATPGGTPKATPTGTPAARATPTSSAAAAAPGEMVPFVIPATPSEKSLIAYPTTPIAVDGPRITVEDGHFAVGGKRVRIWGVNNTFGANVPTHAEAERMAARLAAAGVNGVRFHHMDTSAFPDGILDPKDPLKISTEALERLDYLVDQFARRGITTNLNLHVGRTASKTLGLPDAGTGYDKMVDIFTPALIDAQKQYARDLLGHVNAYRKVRYADDPAVAFVEITNEDSLFMWDARKRLEALPDYYAKILREQYNAWLKKKYGTTDALRQAWAAGAESEGNSLLDRNGLKWLLELHDECKAELFLPSMGAGLTHGVPDGPGVLRIEIAKADDTNWHIQVKQAPLSLEAGRYYTLKIRVRADGPRKIGYAVTQNHEPWKNLGLSGEVSLDKPWKPLVLGFVCTETDTAARVSFSLGGSTTAIDFGPVTIAPGGRHGLERFETIDRIIDWPNPESRDHPVRLFGELETDARSADRGRFLAETEKAYFDTMRTFLKKDLGVKGLITGTIVFGPSGLYGQSTMDFVDGHAYWHHPNFPGRPWDPDNWTVEQEAMVDHPATSTLPGLSAQRLENKPYTVSEYNHPAPNDFQAETVPMLAAWAAAQDWDGVWLFDYAESSRDTATDRIHGFFDMAGNPAKWGFMRAGAAIFRQGGIPPFSRVMSLNITTHEDDVVGDLAALQQRYDSAMMGAVNSRTKFTWQDLLGMGLEVSLVGHSGAEDRGGGPGPELKWEVENGHSVFEAVGPGALMKVLHGPDGLWTITDMPVTRSGSDAEGVAAGGVENLRFWLRLTDFAVVTVTSLDGQPFEKSAAILITACGRAENTDMRFSADRRTVGRNWGTAPARIEPIDATLDLRRGRWKCVALAPDGTPLAGVPITKDPTPGLFDKPTDLLHLLPAYKTMWYLLTPAGKP
jgi:hypothetical protein